MTSVNRDKGIGKSIPKMYILLKSNDYIKSYGHLSMIFLIFNDLLPNMVMSCDTNSLF